MIDEKYKSVNNSIYDTEERQLLVADMVQYISSLAKPYEKDKTGNTKMSEGLRSVACALLPYADCLVLELADAIKNKQQSSDRRKIASPKAKSQLPPDLESIGQEDIDFILDNEKLYETTDS